MRPTPAAFFYIRPASTSIYTLSLHDALPISRRTIANERAVEQRDAADGPAGHAPCWLGSAPHLRSEEHTSELQSHSDLVCRLLLEKKKQQRTTRMNRQRYTDTS